ncbi:RIB43A-like with coiled-coils protein 2 [Bienertia sinuspersici]
MDAILTNALYDQIREGNKEDGDFKSQAYQVVVDNLRAKLDMSVTLDHVTNTIKVWKKHYVTITEIRALTKFKWDEKILRHGMLNVRIIHMHLLIKTSASTTGTIYELWLVSIEQQVMELSNMKNLLMLWTWIEGLGTSETPSGGSNKRLKRDRLVDAISSFTELFKEYVSRAQGPLKPSSQEIYNVVSNVLGISRHQVLKVVKRFMNGTIDEFDMLKKLPEEQKLDWILLCIND